MQCNLECSAVGRNIMDTSHSTSEMNFFTMDFLTMYLIFNFLLKLIETIMNCVIVPKTE